MVKKYQKSIVNLIVIFIFSSWNISYISAQSYTASMKFWSIEDGLSDRNVHTIFKDKNGLMWLGTRNGLNSFDGYEFKHWLGKNEHVDLRNITRIGQDDEGWLWLQRQDNLIFFHPETEKFKTITERFGEDCILNQFSSSHYAEGFQNDDDGRIYFDKYGSNDIYTYHSKEGFLKYSMPSTIRHSNELIVIDPLNIYIQGQIQENFKGFFKLKRQANIQHFDVQDYYISDKNGLLKKSTSTNDQTGDHLINPSSIFNVLKHDFRTGYQWNITFDNHLEVYNKNGNLLVSIFLKNGVEGKKIHFNKIILDGKNRAWICHQFGLYLVDIQPQLFKFTASPKLAKYGQSALRRMAFHDDKLLALLEPANIATLNQHTQNWNLNYIKGANKDIYFKNQNDYWVGGSFYLTHLENGKVTSSSRIPTHGDIWSIEPSNHYPNRLWIGSNKGFYYFDIQTLQFHNYTIVNQLAKDSFLLILDIIPDKTLPNQYWLCTDKGLFLFDEKNENVVVYSDELQGTSYLPASNFQHIYQDKEGIYWLATAGNGLIRWDKEKGNYQQFTMKNGLANDVIYCVYEDDFQNLWMSSDYGIISLHKQTYNVQNYLPSSGIGQREFNRISHLKTENGQIYFGGLNGITTFHPKDFQQLTNKFLPSLVLSNYQIYNGSQRMMENKTIITKQSKKIVLRPSDYIFDLKFSILSYINPENNLYSYQLIKNGQPYTDWQSQKKQSIQLGQLPYGKYQLNIKGTDAFNTTSSNEITLDIIVLRPYYLQWWFIFLIASIILGLTYAYTTWRTKSLEHQRKKLKTEIQKATYQIRQDKQTIEAQAEDLRKLDVLKTRFFANVSHELRTPITLILGPIKSVLKRKNIDNQTHTFLSTAEQNSRKLLKIVNEILDLNKLEAGKLIVREETIAFYPFIKRLASSFTSYAENLKIQFHFDYQIERDIHILLDIKKFETIINNLLSNAFKFTPKGGTISISITELPNKIQVQVKDNGRGIHPEDLPNIFNRFYQSKQNNEAEGGTGIGLALCKELAHLLEGDIHVESKISEGSAFIVEIPKKEVFQTLSDEDMDASQTVFETPTITNNLANKVQSINATNKPTILVVEDNSSLQNYLKLILQDQYQVIIANNGQEALELLTSDFSIDKPSIQLIISDIMMPIMNGYELLKQLKSNDLWRLIPVVMLTARADKSDKLEALRIGVDDYLLKPFDEDELLVRIENLLNNSRERQNEWQSNPLPLLENNASQPVTPFSKEDNEWLKTLEQTVLEQLNTPNFTTETLAQELAISRRQLNRKVKQYTGLTPNKYIIEAKLQKARELLEQFPDLSVKEVSYRVGFLKTTYFSKLFVERFGRKPSEVLV